MAHVTRQIGLSLGADICWPICFEAILKRLDLAIPAGADTVVAVGSPSPAPLGSGTKKNWSVRDFVRRAAAESEPKAEAVWA